MKISTNAKPGKASYVCNKFKYFGMNNQNTSIAISSVSRRGLRLSFRILSDVFNLTKIYYIISLCHTIINQFYS